MLTNTLALAALAAVPALATPAVNVYWGQSGLVTDRLRNYCDNTSFEYVTVGFINNSPEQDASSLKYPGSDFAAHCVEAKYHDTNVNTKLLAQCGQLSADLRYCQKKGKKMLLSIGGEWNPGKANYTVSSPAQGEYFADFIWGAFGPYNPSWGKARPFDDFYGSDDDDKHFSFDGFDFDIEHQFQDQSGYIAMIKKLRALTVGDPSKKYWITAAPECPLSDQFFKMKQIIQKSSFDALFIQFYNNPSCAGVANNNFDAWAAFLATTASKDAKIFIGLPGSSKAAGSGYLSTSEAYTLINKHKNKPAFGGVMVWDVYYGSEKTYSKPFYEHMHEFIGFPPTTTTPAPTSTPTACVKTYTVVPGDICFDIANKFGLDDTAQLVSYNTPTLNGNCDIWAGQVLCV
ncbi:putative glycoside hydrolase, partial [Staphylotrichum tortipilum]